MIGASGYICGYFSLFVILTAGKDPLLLVGFIHLISHSPEELMPFLPFACD